MSFCVSQETLDERLSSDLTAEGNDDDPGSSLGRNYPHVKRSLQHGGCFHAVISALY